MVDCVYCDIGRMNMNIFFLHILLNANICFSLTLAHKAAKRDTLKINCTKWCNSVLTGHCASPRHV